MWCYLMLIYYLYLYLPIYRSIDRSIDLLIYVSIYLYRSISIYIYVSIYLSIYPSVFPSIYIYLSISIYLYLYLSIYLYLQYLSHFFQSINQTSNQSGNQSIIQSTNQSINQFTHQSIYLSFCSFVGPFVRPSVCLLRKKSQYILHASNLCEMGLTTGEWCVTLDSSPLCFAVTICGLIWRRLPPLHVNVKRGVFTCRLKCGTPRILEIPLVHHCCTIDLQPDHPLTYRSL